MKKGLGQGNDAVEHADIPRLDAADKQLGNKALAAVALPLSPPLALPARLHEPQSLFIVNDRVVGPAGPHAFQQHLHGKFHVFRQAVASPAVFPHDIRCDAHARAAESRRQTNIIFRQVPHVVDEPEGDGKGPGHPGIGRILASIYPCMTCSPLHKWLFISRKNSGWTRLSASKTTKASYCFS